MEDDLPVEELEQRSWRMFRWALLVAVAALVAIIALAVYGLYVGLQGAG